MVVASTSNETIPARSATKPIGLAAPDQFVGTSVAVQMLFSARAVHHVPMVMPAPDKRLAFGAMAR